MSSNLNFAPLLHNITPERVVFCYRSDDADSLEIANYYKDARDIPLANFISLPCSDEQYISETDYISTIEMPIISALSGLGNKFTSSGQKEIWVIILGYNVPIAFYDMSDPYADPYDSNNLIAIASRLHRLGQVRFNKFSNFTYDRKDFQFFSMNDAENIFITAVLNGPNKSIVKKLIDRSIVIDNEQYITGKIYIDPYGKKSTTDQIDYQNDILDFVNNELTNLGLDYELTVKTVNNVDPMVRFFQHDSFYFGWFTPRYSKNLFLDQSEKRVFLYNADNDSAANIKSNFDVNGSDPWCNIAINLEKGYACCAGNVSNSDEDAYLRPRPFFEALHQGSTIGEAFLFSSPYVDWKTILIGDPLMVVNFLSPLPDNQNTHITTLSNNEVIRQIKESIEEALAYGFRQSRITSEINQNVVNSNNLSEEIYLLGPTTEWFRQKSEETQSNLFLRAINTFTQYIFKTTGLSISDWLIRQNEKISFFFNEVLGSASLPTNFVYSEGQWQYEISYIHPRQTREYIYFEIQVASNKGFTNILVNINSSESIDGWKYENEKFHFTQLSLDGFPSNFSGRRVRFISPTVNYLTRTELYYIRWRAIDTNNSAIIDWQVDSKRLIIKR